MVMKTSPNICKKNRLLFICKKRYNYDGESYSHLSSGLLNSATFVANMLNENGITAKIIDVVDNNSIDREVASFKPTHVIIEALWVVPQKFEILHKLHPSVQWIIRLHSETPFLSMEGIAIDWLFKYHRMKYAYNVHLGTNSYRMLRDLQSMLNTHDVMYLPNYYPVSFGVKTPTSYSTDTINIGSFGAIRPLKNQFIQALAAKEFAEEIGKDLHYHINVGRVEGKADAILRNIRSLFANSSHTLVEHDWLDHKEFIELVRTMDLGLQLSFSETYNIVSADFVNNNIPVVVSDEIKWVNWMYKADPNELDDIMKHIRFAWNFKRLGLQKLNKINLSNDSVESRITWVSHFKN